MLHSTEALRICSFCSTFIFSNYFWYTIAIHEVKLQLQLNYHQSSIANYSQSTSDQSSRAIVEIALVFLSAILANN